MTRIGFGRHGIGVSEIATTGTPGVLSAPANTKLPSISGTVTQGQTLTADPGEWTGRLAPTFGYQWKRDGSTIGGATAVTRVLALADVGALMTVVVTGTNATGNASATSAAVGPVV